MLLSMAVYRRAFQAALAGQLPYGIALIEVLPEVRLMAHVEEPDLAPQPGNRVELCFRRPHWSAVPVLSVAQPRSDAHSVGRECGSTCRTRWSPHAYTKKIQ